MSQLVAVPGGVRSLSLAIAEGSLSPLDLVERCLARIDEVESEVHAWVGVDAEGARATARLLAREAAEGRLRGPLHGVPVAVKDVIDVEGVPTRANSPARAGAAPARLDATVVARLRAEGAIVLGKVHTTEFAYFESVPPTRNPYDPARTPGGSSGGSAAAVAAGMVPAALGTQTAGSVSRPAAYCGVGAFKPSTAAMSGSGMLPLAPSFDTVGAFAATAADAAAVAAAYAPEALRIRASGASFRRVVLLEDPLIEDCVADPVRTAMTELAEAFGAHGLPVSSMTSPVALRDVLAAHRLVLLRELAGTLGPVAEADPASVAPRIVADIAEGMKVGRDAYEGAVRSLITARRTVWGAIHPDSLIVLPAAPDLAPVGAATGDPTFVCVMTALGGPIASIRAGTCSATGMPVGAMVCAAPGEDGRLAAALWSAAQGPLAT